MDLNQKVTEWSVLE